jgi:hypothetical protein
MSIDDLAPLIGTWEITGRSYNKDTDNVSGTNTFRPILDGKMLQMTGTTKVGDFEVEAIEIIWFDKETGDFPAHAYNPLGPPDDYRWARTGPDTLTHAGNGATYTGTISADGRTITGAWAPDPGSPTNPVTSYEATMRRVD